MNFKRLLMFLAAPLVLVMNSCTPSAPEYTLPKISITNAEGVEINSANFEAEGGEQTITITATRSWSINSQADWFSLSPMSDNNPELAEKAVDVIITVAENTEGTSRNETLKISMDKTTVEFTISQAGKGQVALGDVLFYDNFDKGGQAQKGSSGWDTYMDGAGSAFCNPTPEYQANVSYTGTKLTVRSNSSNGSGGTHSNYEGSGMNYLWFGTAPTNFSVSGISLAELEGNSLTLSFGTERYEYNATDNTFKNDEFKVYISGDGEKWSQIEYTFIDGVNLNGKWNIATAQFNLKEVPETLSIYFTATVGSAYALDDLKLTAGGGGVEIDLSAGSAIEGAGGGNQGGGNTGEVVKATVQEFLNAAEDNTIYELTGVIGGTIKAYYGNFDLTDATGTVYIYGLVDANGTFIWDNLGLKAGDTITVQGKRTSYNGSPQMKNGLYISHVAGEEGGNQGGGDEPEPEPGDVIVATIGEFLNASESKTQWYQLTGEITSIEKADYGNIYIQDESGSVLIYGLCATQVEKNDKSFSTLGLKVGDIVTLNTLRTSYNGTPQGGGTPPAYYISHEEGEPEPEPELPDGATAVSIVFSQQGLANAESVDGRTFDLDDNISLVFGQGGANNAPAYYDSGSAIRMYQNGAILDVEATGKTIISIELTFASNMYYVIADSGELSAEAMVRTWTGEADAVRFTCNGTDKNHRAYVAAIKVIYK